VFVVPEAVVARAVAMVLAVLIITSIGYTLSMLNLLQYKYICSGGMVVVG
jgi:hypothetical protein